MKRSLFVFFVLIMSLIMVACGGTSEGDQDTLNDAEDTTMNEEENHGNIEAQEVAAPSDTNNVTVELQNTEGQNVGKAELEQTEAGVVINLEASNLPAGEHGFHIHETGMCEAPSFESAFGHFNPTGASHGLDHEDGPHAGDLPNILVSEDGSVQEKVIAELVTLQRGEEHSLLRADGTALVIHEDADDNISQPAGNAGNRIACGVISE